MQEQYVEIDGSLYEGGGQMIRSSLALGTILHKGFRMHSIRKNRPNPGINNQLRSVFSAFGKVPQVGEKEVYIYPKLGNVTHIKTSTAASCNLMLQCFVPIFAALGYNKQVKIQGGTDVSRSPCQQSVNLGLIPLMKRMGVQLQIVDIKKGYYPKGNGYIVIKVKGPDRIMPIQFTKFTPPNKVVITYYLKGDKLPNSSKDFIKQIRTLMVQHFPQQKVQVTAKIHRVSYVKEDQYGIGCMVLGDGMVWDVGTVGERTEEGQVLQRLRHYLQEKQNYCLDEHHQDQLLLLAALATGTSRLRVGKQLSLHTQSLFYVIKKFIPEFTYRHTEQGILQIQGIGYKCAEQQGPDKKEQSDSDNQ